jgi:hypothetical protein
VPVGVALSLLFTFLLVEVLPKTREGDKMKNRKIHLIIGTALCAALIFLFAAFWNRLPETVVIQTALDGSAGNTLPKPLFVFGMPLLFAVINFVGLSFSKKEDISVYRFYIVPAAAVLVSIVILIMALHSN